ncbi:unnamed protein product [Effrenium voratum]|nr:unnamed protein product [Effrenium voratum]
MGKKAAGKKEEKQTRSQWEGKHPEPKSRVDERKVVATVKLAAPVCNLLEFKLDCSPSTKISFIVDRIIDRHGGSISDLSVCVNRFHPEEIVGRAWEPRTALESHSRVTEQPLQTCFCTLFQSRLQL